MQNVMTVPTTSATANTNGAKPQGRRLRIGFIDYVVEPDKPGVSGLSDNVWSRAREFAKLGDEVHIVGPYTVEPEPVEGITVHRYPIPPIGYRNIAGHAMLILRAWKELRAIPGLDVIHSHDYLSTGIIAPRSSIPVVLTTPGNIYERIANGNPFDWTTTQALKVAARSSARYCKLINATSTDMGRWWLLTGAEPERIVVIPHGVETDVFHRIENAAQQLPLAPGERPIIYIGRLSPEKQVDVLIRAFAALTPEFEEARLHVFGKGPQEPELRALAASLDVSNRVVFHGSVPKHHLPLWYSAADAVVLPSRSEPLGRVMLEAMACAAPFVATRVSGPLDHIRHGENGYLVEPENIEELTACLRHVLRHPDEARAVGRRGQEYALQSLTWPRSVARLREAILDRLSCPARLT